MKTLSILSLSLLLVACSAGIDPLEPPSELTTFKPELKLKTDWYQNVGVGTGGKYLKLMPLLLGEHLYLADRFGTVRAFHALTGEAVWEVVLQRAVGAGPGEAGDLLLFGGDAELFALDRNSGELRWHSAIGSEVLSTPVSHGDVVVVHAVDGSITAVDVHTGNRLWRHLERVPSLTLQGSSRPLIVDGSRVVVGTADGQVIALNLQDGALLWRATIATARGRTDLERMVDVDADMVAADGVIYAASYQGSVAAIHAANGQLLWSREISSQSGISIDDSALYLSDEAGDVWALSRRSGVTLWKQAALHRRALSAPAQQGRYLILGDYDGYLHWLNKEDGHLAARGRVRNWQELFPLPREFVNRDYVEEKGVLVSPLVEGTRVYAVDRRGVLNAFDISILKPAG